jgi:toxin-antitoxin system PIN domain toxin
MIVPDLNLLLYAVNSDCPEHRQSRTFWEGFLNGKETVGIAWIVVLGFLRISTSPRVFSSPLSIRQALEIVDSWIDTPLVRIINPGDHHYEILKILLLESGSGGNLTTDAHLAALCIEKKATLYTADNDFGRFAALRWKNPLH